MKNTSRLKFGVVRGEVYVFLQSDLPLEWPQTANAALSYIEPLKDLTQSMEVVVRQWRAANGRTSLAVKATDNTNMAGWSWTAVFTTNTRSRDIPHMAISGLGCKVTRQFLDVNTKQAVSLLLFPPGDSRLSQMFAFKFDYFYSNVGQQSHVYISLYMWPKVIQKGKNNLNMESYR